MSNKRISIFVNASPLSNKYYPLLEKLGDDLCCFYGTSIGRKQTIPSDLKCKVNTPGIGLKLFNRLLSHFLKLFRLPLYYEYWINVRILDALYSRKVASDDSSIVYINPLFRKTAERAKATGKTLVVEAANSDPVREHERIKVEYAKFGIKHQYIYGNPMYRDTCISSLKYADKIVTISEVSRQTYINAGYPLEKFELIPLTGTDFPIQQYQTIEGREKAFITTSFHSFIKGTHRLLLSWKKANIHDIPLYVIGTICEDMKEFIEKYGPFDNVIYVGHQSNLPEWYSARDAVGALLSLSEGAVRVTPEMMSFGFPMIVSPDATCDLIKEGINGFVIETEDVDSVASRLKWFADDWNRVHDMRKNVLDTVRSRTTRDWSIDVANYLLSL